MKKSTISLMLAFVLLGGMVFTTSCKKSRLNKETTTDEDNSLAESSFDDIDKTASEVAVKEEGVKSKLAPGSSPDYSFGANCANITHKDANGNILYVNGVKYDTTLTDSALFIAPFPRTITIDFGTGCSGNDGRTRKGKIMVSLSAKFWAVGAVITHTLDNYYVNDHHVEGTRTVTHSSTDVWQVVVSGARITDPDGKTVTWESTRTRTRIAGGSTPIELLNIFDDVYSITGTASGTNREGRNFTVNITTALQLQACSYIAEITKGVIEIQPEDLKVRTVDFGDGSCDNEGTVTVGNKTKTFKLRK